MYVEVALTVGAVAGSIIYYWEELLNLYSKLRLKLISSSVGVKSEGINDLYYMPEGFNQIIRRLIKITIGIDYKYSGHIFMIFTFFIAVFVATITYRQISNILRSILILIFSLLPMIILLARLQRLRVKSSREGKRLVIELLDNYKIYYYNMQHAIEITASTIEEAPNCRRLLFNLSKGLNRVTGSEDIRALLVDFKYAIGTSWAGILTDNIYFSLTSGIKVDVALADLIESIAMAEEVEERSKRENNEVGLILKYLVPICYILTYIGAIKVFGLTNGEFIYYQFKTVTGISWFVSIVVMYIISLIAKFFLTQNKLDI